MPQAVTTEYSEVWIDNCRPSNQRYLLSPLLISTPPIALEFACSTTLLGLTAYRINYTKHLSNGDILTNNSNFYDPIIVELLVTSILALLFSLFLIAAVFSRFGTGAKGFFAEHAMMWIIWIMFLVGAAITAHTWRNTWWCRGGYKECRIIAAIKAFSWICWILATFALIASAVNFFQNKDTYTSNRVAASEVRQTPGTGATTYVAHNNRTTSEAVADAT
ncbi:hypothetical protein HYPSUDRAFT_198867 [Hypholoma sublateritium FD-334 SS-4]|uniref:MARVEL domain-containing protein n=1 Tax=Hypholoma sublateritium (strain FD-334 SS-4) TaxID=945553 RepID=A0A0D2PDG6_HYPSF|nr:hypothetical protein HYPSUDRAFT_198867 [Hypholoma sublateritium FD-334 SS-4]